MSNVGHPAMVMGWVFFLLFGMKEDAYESYTFLALSCALALASIALAGCSMPQRSGHTAIGVRTANDHAPFFIADRQQLYRGRNLSVTVRAIPNNTEIIETLQGWASILAYYTASWPNHPCCVVIAREDWAQPNPRALESILAAHCDAVEWANAHLDETAEIITDYLQGFDAPLVRASLEPSKMLTDYHIQDGTTMS